MALLQTSSCIICQNPNINFLIEKNSYKIFRCQNCGHGWVENMPDQKTLTAFYESQSAEQNQYQFSEKIIRKHAARLVRWVMQIKKNPGNWLDIGSGRGVHLQVAREKGWQVTGVDTSVQARRFSCAKNIRTYESLESIEGPTKFDVISLWEAIEHLVDPAGFLKKIKIFLKKDGVLVFSTPNFQSAYARKNYAAWQELRPPLHLNYFTPKSLRLLLEKEGFQVLSLITYGAWNASVEEWPGTFRFLKVLVYKVFKFHFDRKQQKPLQGLGLISMANLEESKNLSFLKEYFYA